MQHFAVATRVLTQDATETRDEIQLFDPSIDAEVPQCFAESGFQDVQEGWWQMAGHVFHFSKVRSVNVTCITHEKMT